MIEWVRDQVEWHMRGWVQWCRDSWYILTTPEGCQKPVGNGHCRRKHRHRGFHKPYKE